MRPRKRQLSDDERSVLLSELLIRHPELVAEAEEITSTLLVVENDQKLADEITARLRALRPSGPVSIDAGQARVLDALQPYIDDLTWRNERGARRAAADIAIAILLGLHACRDDTDEDMLLVRMGLPGAADDPVLVGSGILWATQVSAHGNFWSDLAGPLFLAGACSWAFIPVSIGALAGVAERDAGVGSGLLNTSQQLGGAVGVAVASTVAATRSRDLLLQGHAAAAALTGGFQWAFWVSGLTALAAVPVTFLVIRRKELAQSAAAAALTARPVTATAA